MLSIGLVVAAGLAWLGLLFVAGLYGERHPEAFAARGRIQYSWRQLQHISTSS